MARGLNPTLTIHRFWSVGLFEPRGYVVVGGLDVTAWCFILGLLSPSSD